MCYRCRPSRPHWDYSVHGRYFLFETWSSAIYMHLCCGTADGRRLCSAGLDVCQYPPNWGEQDNPPALIATPCSSLASVDVIVP